MKGIKTISFLTTLDQHSKAVELKKIMNMKNWEDMFNELIEKELDRRKN